MKPAVVFPFHDPEGTYFGHLQAILPNLKNIFSDAILSIPPGTAARSAAHVAWLQGDGFFKVLLLPAEMPVGKHFLSLYEFGVAVSEPEQVLHVCYIDRLAFALQTPHQVQFIRDIESVTAADTPLVFQRSQKAWDTHPRNYAEVERFATMIGERLLGKSLDFAWCHIAVQAAWFRDLLVQIDRLNADDISVVAELILLGRDRIQTRDVDWLAWEDPFFLSQDSEVLKRAREMDAAETRKRLAYILPMINRIIAHAHQV